MYADRLLSDSMEKPISGLSTIKFHVNCDKTQAWEHHDIRDNIWREIRFFQIPVSHNFFHIQQCIELEISNLLPTTMASIGV